MSAKAEIAWKTETPEGERREVYARHVGKDWRFFQRARRYDIWEPLPEPTLEDWMALLDAVERRVQRRLQRPEEPERLRQLIRSRFPDAAV